MKLTFTYGQHVMALPVTVAEHIDKATKFISLKNYEPINPTFEKLQLTINMKYSIDGRKKGVFLALRQNVDEPVVKKFVISKEKLKDKEKEALKKELCIEKEERTFIEEKGFWYPNINNNNGF